MRVGRKREKGRRRKKGGSKKKKRRFRAAAGIAPVVCGQGTQLVRCVRVRIAFSSRLALLRISCLSFARVCAMVSMPSNDFFLLSPFSPSPPLSVQIRKIFNYDFSYIRIRSEDRKRSSTFLSSREKRGEKKKKKSGCILIIVSRWSKIA